MLTTCLVEITCVVSNIISKTYFGSKRCTNDTLWTVKILILSRLDQQSYEISEDDKKATNFLRLKNRKILWTICTPLGICFRMEFKHDRRIKPHPVYDLYLKIIILTFCSFNKKKMSHVRLTV